MQGYSGEKDAITKRLHRIEGQVRGIERMVEDDRYCIDILDQISAVSTALEKVGLRVLDGHVNHCVSDAMRSGDPQAAEAKTQELLHAVERFARAR
ncbi:MAG TPA: metal-sensing transcriptional repressor [Gaiellales bacterium]|jgi:DNA-binding FrmR family transcriptional regulator|nr:metal-sensing transcriptional repressor [Gaiellales bacterium]